MEVVPRKHALREEKVAAERGEEHVLPMHTRGVSSLNELQLRQRERACEMMYEAFLTAATATGNACKMCRDQFRAHNPDTNIPTYAHSHN